MKISGYFGSHYNAMLQVVILLFCFITGHGEPMGNQSPAGKGKYLGAIVAAICIWSTSFVATKLAFSSFPPLTLGACRFIVATVLLGGVLLYSKSYVRPSARDAGLMALSGFLGITLYFAMENIGVSLTSASNAALIVASYPAITLLLERIMYRIPVSPLRAFGVALAILGVYVISSSDGKEYGEGRLAGNIILAATGIVWAFYNFTTRKVVNRYPALTVSFVQTLAGTAAFIPLALIEVGQWTAPTCDSLVVLAYLGIFCSVAAFMLYNFGLRRVSAGAAVTVLNLVPVFGVLMSVLVLGEDVKAIQLLGGAVVIAGVFLSVKKEATPE